MGDYYEPRMRTGLQYFSSALIYILDKTCTMDLTNSSVYDK